MTYSPGDISEAIGRALAETLESMAFMEVTPGEVPPVEAHETDTLWSGIGIFAPVTGRITLVVPQSLALDITETVFGFGDVEQSIEELALDTLAEIINTLAGRLMARLVPEDQTFELGLPESGAGWPPASGPSREQRLGVEEETVVVLTEGDLIGDVPD